MFGRKKVVPQQVGSSTNQGGVHDPIVEGAKYVGCVSGPGNPIFVDGLSEPTACFRGNEDAGVCYLFTSSVAGSGKVYLFRSFASIWVDGEATPRSQIPTEMISNRIAHYEAALIDLLAASPGRHLPRIAGAGQANSSGSGANSTLH